MTNYVVVEGEFKKYPFSDDILGITEKSSGDLILQSVSVAADERHTFLVKPENSDYRVRLGMVSVYNNMGAAGSWDFGLYPLHRHNVLKSLIEDDDTYAMYALADPTVRGIALGQPFGSLGNQEFGVYDYSNAEVEIYRAGLMVANVAVSSAGSKNSSLQGYAKLLPSRKKSRFIF